MVLLGSRFSGFCRVLLGSRVRVPVFRYARKNMEKENSDESDFSENEILDLNSLKPFKFKAKTNIEILTIVAVMMRKKVLNIK